MKKSFYSQIDNLMIDFYPSITGDANLSFGVSGDSLYNFSISGKKIFHNNRLLASLNPLERAKISMAFGQNTYDLFFNNSPLFLNELKATGILNSFYINDGNSSLSSYDLYISGNAPDYVTTGYAINLNNSGFSGAFINQGNFPIKINSISVDNTTQQASGFAYDQITNNNISAGGTGILQFINSGIVQTDKLDFSVNFNTNFGNFAQLFSFDTYRSFNFYISFNIGDLNISSTLTGIHSKVINLKYDIASGAQRMDESGYYPLFISLGYESGNTGNYNSYETGWFSGSGVNQAASGEINRVGYLYGEPQIVELYNSDGVVGTGSGAFYKFHYFTGDYNYHLTGLANGSGFGMGYLSGYFTGTYSGLVSGLIIGSGVLSGNFLTTGIGNFKQLLFPQWAFAEISGVFYKPKNVTGYFRGEQGGYTGFGVGSGYFQTGIIASGYASDLSETFRAVTGHKQVIFNVSGRGLVTGMVSGTGWLNVKPQNIGIFYTTLRDVYGIINGCSGESSGFKYDYVTANNGIRQSYGRLTGMHCYSTGVEILIPSTANSGIVFYYQNPDYETFIKIRSANICETGTATGDGGAIIVFETTVSYPTDFTDMNSLYNVITGKSVMSGFSSVFIDVEKLVLIPKMLGSSIPTYFNFDYGIYLPVYSIEVYQWCDYSYPPYCWNDQPDRINFMPFQGGTSKKFILPPAYEDYYDSQLNVRIYITGTGYFQTGHMQQVSGFNTILTGTYWRAQGNLDMTGTINYEWSNSGLKNQYINTSGSVLTGYISGTNQEISPLGNFIYSNYRLITGSGLNSGLFNFSNTGFSVSGESGIASLSTGISGLIERFNYTKSFLGNWDLVTGLGDTGSAMSYNQQNFYTGNVYFRAQDYFTGSNLQIQINYIIQDDLDPMYARLIITGSGFYCNEILTGARITGG